MLAAMALFVCNDALMKLAREVYPAGQAITLRTGFALLSALALVILFKEGAKLRLAFRPIVLLRGLIDAGALRRGSRLPSILELSRTLLNRSHVELLLPRLQELANRFEATATVWQSVGDKHLLGHNLKATIAELEKKMREAAGNLVPEAQAAPATEGRP